MIEIWKDIKDYEGFYRASNTGKIMSLRRLVICGVKEYYTKERVLKTATNNTGYHHLVLSVNGVKKSFLIHRLVAQTFIANPENKTEVNHIDGDKSSNGINNLEWNFSDENTQHAWRNNLATHRGENHKLTNLTQKDVDEIQ